MEKIDKVFSENPKDKASLDVNIFRHGEANYNQREVSIDQAEDLTEKGIEEVKANVAKLAELIGPDEEVEIWSSPMGRTLHTAKLIAEVLENKGIRLRKKGDARETGIKVHEQLTEVKNFSWNLFCPLLEGGEVEFGGKKFTIDKSLTNPKNLGYQEYFLNDEIKNIPQEVRDQLPKEYLDTKRMMKPLEHLKKLEDKPYRIIMVTHDALTGFIANVFSGGEQSGINPGEFINLERKDGKIVATKVGQSIEGDNDIDVIGEFDKQNKK